MELSCRSSRCPPRRCPCKPVPVVHAFGAFPEATTPVKEHRPQPILLSPLSACLSAGSMFKHRKPPPLCGEGLGAGIQHKKCPQHTNGMAGCPLPAPPEPEPLQAGTAQPSGALLHQCPCLLGAPGGVLALQQGDGVTTSPPHTS